MMLTDYPYVSRCLCYFSSYPRLPFQDCQTYPAGAIGTLTPRAKKQQLGKQEVVYQTHLCVVLKNSVQLLLLTFGGKSEEIRPTRRLV